MNKLEEIRKHRDIADADKDEYEFEKVNFYNLYADWFIERVDILYRKLQEMHEVYDIRRAESNEIEKQNKRYREGLLNLKDHIEKRWNQGYAIEAVLYIDMLLEEDSDE